MNSLYRHGRIVFLAVLFHVKSFREFLVRFDMLKRISKADKEILDNIKRMEAEIVRRSQELEEQKARERVEVSQLRAKQIQIQLELVEVRNLLAGVQKEIDKLEKQERAERERLARLALSRRRGAVAVAAVKMPGFVFPVAGTHAYSSTFGDYRSGGRSHQGNDIYALKGTPVVAVVNGTIEELSRSGLGGIILKLRGDDGNTYSYMHLNAYAPGVGEGMRVSAGQVIGYVGNTGNASNGPDHLHFEIHPGGGGAIDPYPILRGVE